jgi:hypothetical protein
MILPFVKTKPSKPFEVKKREASEKLGKSIVNSIEIKLSRNMKHGERPEIEEDDGDLALNDCDCRNEISEEEDASEVSLNLPSTAYPYFLDMIEKKSRTAKLKLGKETERRMRAPRLRRFLTTIAITASKQFAQDNL